MCGDARRVKLSSRCYVDEKLYRPLLEEAKEYYSRGDVLHEMLAAMHRWHVRLEPGEGRKHRWFNVDSHRTIRRTLIKHIDFMQRHPGRYKYPYMRIDALRYDPVPSWDGKDLWGLDLIIEKDGKYWRSCWRAVAPVIDLLHHFGVYYWLKYTGHHSLHVVIPAENFPVNWGNVKLVNYLPSFGARLVAFFDKFCYQPLDETGFQGAGGTGGTNMPFTLNEDTGLLNYPVLKSEVDDFEPWKASIGSAYVRSFWREFSEAKHGSAVELINEVLLPFSEMKMDYGIARPSLPIDYQDCIKLWNSGHFKERRQAVLMFPWFNTEEVVEQLTLALEDPRSEVRKNAVKAMIAVDYPKGAEILAQLSTRLLKSGMKRERNWILKALKINQDIEVLRNVV